MTIKGGINIEIDERFVEQTIRTTYLNVTHQITGIALESIEKHKKRIFKPVSAVIMSRGIFKSKVVCTFPKRFLAAVLDGMNGGSDVEEDDKQAYIKEYLNICFGRVISVINNEMGRASRFVIPVIIDGIYRDSGQSDYKSKIEMEFIGPYGVIRIHINYDVLPEFSSN